LYPKACASPTGDAARRRPFGAYVTTVSPRTALIEAKPENPGRITLRAQGAPDRVLSLASLTRAELIGLGNEIAQRGVEVELQNVDVEAATPAHGAYAALRELGFAPPYAAYDATVTHMGGTPTSGTGV
jgi:hypothetical protein